jgi:protein AbiQ
MKKLDLYDVSKEYVSFLQKAEIEIRGFTRVPNMEYPNREQKFLCGTVMNVNGIDYYVSATSYKKQQSENILIIFKHDRDPIKGSLRFNYMFPIPKEMVTRRIIQNEPNTSRRLFLSKQLDFFNDNVTEILNKAAKTYNKVIRKFSPYLCNNSCDFKLLEEKCIEYCKLHNLKLPLDPETEKLKREVSELLEQMKKDKEKSASGSGRGR